MHDGPRYSIHDLVKKTKFPQRRIRHWIEVGVLPPTDGADKSRPYTQAHLDRLLFIQVFRRALPRRVNRKTGRKVIRQRIPQELLKRIFLETDAATVARVASGEEALELAGDAVASLSEVMRVVANPGGSMVAEEAPLPVAANRRAVVDFGSPQSDAGRVGEPWMTIEIEEGVELRMRGDDPDRVQRLARVARRLREWWAEDDKKRG